MCRVFWIQNMNKVSLVMEPAKCSTMIRAQSVRENAVITQSRGISAMQNPTLALHATPDV